MACLGAGVLLAAFACLVVSAETLYVSKDNPGAEAPYTNWAMAAGDIQTAIDAAADGDTIMVAYSVYAPLSQMTTVTINKPVSIVGLTNPVIRGYVFSSRCVYMVEGATLRGFWIEDGRVTSQTEETNGCGGGVYAEGPGAIISNCVITRCFAGMFGGGAYGGTLIDCVIATNRAILGGCGVYGSTLYGCTVTHNVADGSGYGGGAAFSELHDCYVGFNYAVSTGGGVYASTLYGCTLIGNGVEAGGRGGGAMQSTLSNCIVSGHSITGFGAGVAGSTLYDCIVTNNRTDGLGGGAYDSILYRTMLSQNRAGSPEEYSFSKGGGGAANSTLYGCEVSSNSAELGGGALSCVVDGSLVSGNVAGVGGGAYQSVLSNCVVMGNVGDPGGTWGGYLYNCLVIGNEGTFTIAGGANFGSFYNCTITGNRGYVGGGVANAALSNCVVYGNYADHSAPDCHSCTLSYSCTPEPAAGEGNITNAPMFVDPGSGFGTNHVAGDYRLQSDSPCINTGTNQSWMGIASDLDGKPRVIGGRVDMGAYEYGTPTEFQLWLQGYRLATDGSADHTDDDGDDFDNWQEWRSATVPTNVLSYFRFQDTGEGSGEGVVVRWPSIAGRVYSLERATDLRDEPAFGTLVTGIAGQPDSTSYTDTTATAEGPYFYRVGVE